MSCEKLDDRLPAKDAAPKPPLPLAETLALRLSLTCCSVCPATMSVSLSLISVAVTSHSRGGMRSVERPSGSPGRTGFGAEPLPPKERCPAQAKLQ